jgi:PPK2 family polyphosphate:nucleotide phosphotransferase
MDKLDLMIEKALRVGGKRLRLESIAPRETPLPDDLDKESGRSVLDDVTADLVELQRILYAASSRAVLVVLQGLDTSGKDGTIRHVFGPLNPQGVRVASFKRPTTRELAHDYLWRVHARTPAKGMIGIFNRSHYEDYVVPAVADSLGENVLKQRLRQLADFERHLAENAVTIVKFFLHISKAEQKDRLQARLDTPHKRWKFEPQDLVTRKAWDRYTAAYERVIAATSKPHARWYVVPADRKWARNLMIGSIVRLTLQRLDLRYPKPKLDLEGIVIED